MRHFRVRTHVPVLAYLELTVSAHHVVTRQQLVDVLVYGPGTHGVAVSQKIGQTLEVNFPGHRPVGEDGLNL